MLASLIWLRSAALPMPVKLVLAFAFCGLALSAQASEAAASLPSLALDPPASPTSSWSGLPDTGQFTPYAGPGVGLAKPNSAPGDVGASQPASTPKAAPTRGAGLDYDLGNNLHMHLDIIGGAMAGGIIRH
jgi:hypothetical protein